MKGRRGKEEGTEEGREVQVSKEGRGGCVCGVVLAVPREAPPLKTRRHLFTLRNEETEYTHGTISFMEARRG